MQRQNEGSRKRGHVKWSRREILGTGAGVLAAVTGGCAARSQTSSVSSDLEPPAAAELLNRYKENIYTRLLGVQPHLPAHDHVTRAGGSRMPREVIDAMREANEYFVDMGELTVAAGRRLAEVTETEDALVTAGAFSAMVLGAAACLTGTDLEKIAALPHATWPKPRVPGPKGPPLRLRPRFPRGWHANRRGRDPGGPAKRCQREYGDDLGAGQAGV